MLKFMKYMTPTLLVVALFGAVMWAIRAPDFEPAITSLGLLASLIAIFAEKWVSEKERRKELLLVLFNELFLNLQFKFDLEKVGDPESVNNMKIYPRFHNMSVSTVIASGAFTGSKDSVIYQAMSFWHQCSSDYNNRLHHTELRVFANQESVTTYNTMLAKGEVSLQTFEALDDVMEKLIQYYGKEIEITQESFKNKLKITLAERA